ncbi:RICIN domain-containing protein [Chryseobacterium wanjuense]
MVTGIRPDQRNASVPLPANSQPGKYYVSVTLEDIFKQSSNFGYNSLTISSIVLPPNVDPNAFYRIKCVGSNQYITPANYSTAANAKMVQQSFNSNLAQQWKLEKTGNNYIIINRASGLAIDVPGSNITSGTNLIQYPKHGGINQQWVLRTYAPNVYIIGTALSSLKAMDNPANSQTPGTNINIWDQDINGTAGVNHQWVLEMVSTSAMKGSINVLADENQTSTLYPNPVRHGESFYINLPEQDRYELQIVNAEGFTVKSQDIKGGKTSVSTSDMRRGVYFYKAKGKTKTASGKFTIE